MKFFAPFSALLCALSLGINAAPIENVKSLDLEIRSPAKTPDPVSVQTDDYKYFKGLKSDIAVGTTYLFTMKSPIDPNEKDQKTKDLTAKLGFSHIYLLSVKVTESKKTTAAGPKKGQVTTTTDVEAWGYDMVGTAKVSTRKTVFKRNLVGDKKIEYVKTTKKTDKQIDDEGKAYIKIHPDYEFEVGKNNCDTYVKDLIAYA
ncbi:hypothetical protein BGZ60DRAFT_509984 [Tricladium varicosporioides]|nr:hypothetical protein BGZ60DRAFT_509984 [Hymenoscyphus varicosporioides]